MCTSHSPTIYLFRHEERFLFLTVPRDLAVSDLRPFPCLPRARVRTTPTHHAPILQDL